MYLLPFRHKHNDDEKVTMLTYRNGDKEWAAKQFKINTNFAQISCKIVYLSGILYIVSPYRQVALYNIVDEEFKFEHLFKDNLFHLNSKFSRTNINQTAKKLI